MAADQPAGPARQQRHDQDEGQQRAAGGSTRIAMHLHQVEGQEEQPAAQRRVEHEGDQVGAAEAARAEQVQRHHRRLAARLHREEQGQRSGPTAEGEQDARGTEPDNAGFDQPIYQKAETGGAEERARPVEPARRRLVSALGDPGIEDPHHDDRRRHVDEEDPAPGDRVDQPAAQHRAERHGQRRGCRPDAEGAATLLLAEGGADHRQAARAPAARRRCLVPPARR